MAEFGVLDLDGTEAPAQGPLNLEGGDKPLLPEKVVNERSAKADFGLGASSPGVGTLSSAIARGDEKYAREMAANNVALREREQRIQLADAAMKANPGLISPEFTTYIQSLTQEQVKDPNTIFETEYAKEYINRLATTKQSQEALFPRQLETNTERTLATMDFAQSHVARNEITRTKIEDLRTEWDDMSMFSKGADIVSTMIPLRSWVAIANSGEKFNDGVLDSLPGKTKANKVQYLWSISDPEAFNRTFTAAVEELRKYSLTDALDFAQAVQAYSTSSEFLDNAFGVMDLFDVGTLASMGFKSARVARGAASRAPEDQLRKALKDSVEVSGQAGTRAEKVTEVLGDVDQASKIKAIQNRVAENPEQALKNEDEKYRGFQNLAPSITNPGRVFAEMGNLTREMATRLDLKLQASANRLIDAVTESVAGERLSPQALAKASENAITELRAQYNQLNDSVMDVVRNPRDRVTNTDSVSIRLGDTQAKPFENYEKAELWARDLYNIPEDQWRIKHEGPNFFIDIPKNIDETSPDVRKLLEVEGNKAPKSNPFVELFVNRFRTPAETTSEQGRANRNLAAIQQAQFNRTIEEAATVFSKLPNDHKDDFNRIWRMNRDNVNPATGERGLYYDTVGALEEAYMSTNNRLPTEREIEAYFTAVQLNDLDLVLRNSMVYNNKARMGIQKFSFRSLMDKNLGDEAFMGLNSFEGKRVDFMPWNSDHLTVAVYDPTNASFSFLRKGASDEQRAMVDQLIKDGGYQVVKIADPLGRPLEKAAGTKEAIEYVITKSFEVSPIDLQQVNRRPGGHVQYKGDGWVKQPKLFTAQGGVRYYEGDTTAFNFLTKGQAEKWAERMEGGRRLLNDPAALAAYAQKNLPYSAEEFKALFKDGGPFVADQPFFAASSGQKWSDLNQLDKGVRNLSSGEYSMTSDYTTGMTGHRDWNALTIKDVGTESNPVFNLHQGSDMLLDPMPTLQRALGQISRSRFFNDMKVNAAETFAQQFRDVLDVDAGELAKYPLYYLTNAKFKTGADPVAVAQATTMRNNAIAFLGEKTPFGKNIDWVKSKLIDAVNAVKPEWADSLSQSKLMTSSDPTTVLRGIAFHTKLGLFNPAQLLVQANGLFNVALISPRLAPTSMAGYTLMRAAMVNGTPEVFKSLAQKSLKLGWRQGEFEEAWTAMNRSGWNNIGREAAVWDDITDPSLFRSGRDSILNAGTVFFNEGERAVRMAAWNTSFLEWRRANPLKALDDRNIGLILNRAETLSGNMTRASKASWEQGIFSIPAQFSSYSARILEQFWGKQLTMGEKARMFGGFGLLYGMPLAGAAATGVPFYEMAKQAAIDNGYVNSDVFANLFYEGGLAAIGSAMTGQDYNVAQRYGPGGFQFIRDWLTGDKSGLEIAIGPSGNAIGDIIKSVVPIFNDLSEVFKEGGSFEPTIHDLVDATRNITSVNATLKTMVALQTGKYITKNEVYMSDMNSWDAVFSSITGLTPREVTDAMLMKQSMKDLEGTQKEATKNFEKNIKRGLNEQANGNRTAAEAYFRRARSYLIVGGFQPNEYATMLQRAINNQQSVIDRIGTQWWKKSPPTEQQKRMEQTKQTFENRERRNSN